MGSTGTDPRQNEVCGLLWAQKSGHIGDIDIDIGNCVAALNYLYANFP